MSLINKNSPGMVPGVNIMITWDAEAAVSFQAYESFLALKEAEKDNQLVHIFDNAPNSQILSLEHSFTAEGDGEGEGATMTIEFIDPQGIFEEDMLDVGLEADLDTVGSAYTKQLEKLVEKEYTQMLAISRISEAIRREEEKDQKNQSAEALKKLKSKKQDAVAVLRSTTEKRMEIDPYLIKKGKVETTGKDVRTQKIRLLKQEMIKTTPLLARPVFITYGVGDNLKDWAPLQCYGKVVGAEYDFSGKDVRKLKLIWAATKIFPNLTQMGMTGMGALGVGIRTWGSSYRLFNKDSNDNQKKNWKALLSAAQKGSSGFAAAALTLLDPRLEEAFVDEWKPSYHIAITDAITNFIKKGTNYKNVYVILPDLDLLLTKLINGAMKQVTKSLGDRASKEAIYFAVFRTVVESLGFQITTSPAGYVSPIGKVGHIYREEVEVPKDVQDWWTGRDVRLVAQCDNVTETFLQKLQSISKAISEQTGDQTPFSADFPRVETDFQIIDQMWKAGMIEDHAKPVIVWGDDGLINKYLYALGMLPGPEQTDMKGFSKADIEKIGREGILEMATIRDMIVKLHPSTQVKLTPNYMNKILDYYIPPGWLGAFGPQGVGSAGDDSGGDEYFLPEGADKEISPSVGDEDDLQNKKSVLRGRIGKRMPIFAFGTKNPNVLSVSIDINKQFAAMVATAGPINPPSKQMTAAVIGGDYNDKETKLFNQIKNVLGNLRLKDNIPEGFKKIVRDQLAYDQWDWWLFGKDLGVRDLGGLEEVINNLGGQFEKVSEAEFDTWDEAYKYFWKAFQLIINGDPKMDQIVPGKGRSAEKSGIRRIADSAAKMASQTMTGTITTLPMFSLSTQRRAISRPCLLYCIEPRLSTYDRDIHFEKSTTWFSGFYELFGFTHTVNSSNIESSFMIAKSTNSGLMFSKGTKK